MSPRSESQLKVIREQSQERILDAALELFGTVGFNATTTAQIAEHAGVSKGLIYNYFDSKQALMQAIVNRALSEGADIIAKMEAETSPKGKLRLIIDASFDFVLNDPHKSQLFVGLSLQIDQFPELTELIKSKYSGQLPLISNLLRELGVSDPEAEARMLAALMDGVALQYIVLKDALPVEDIRQHLLAKYKL